MYLEDMIKVLNMYYMYFGPLKMYLWAALYTTSVAFVPFGLSVIHITAKHDLAHVHGQLTNELLY